MAGRERNHLLFDNDVMFGLRCTGYRCGSIYFHLCLTFITGLFPEIHKQQTFYHCIGQHPYLSLYLRTPQSITVFYNIPIYNCICEHPYLTQYSVTPLSITVFDNIPIYHCIRKHFCLSMYSIISLSITVLENTRIYHCIL